MNSFKQRHGPAAFLGFAFLAATMSASLPQLGAAEDPSGKFELLEGILIERPIVGSNALDAKPVFGELPDVVFSLLGPNTVEYDSFVISYLFEAEAEVLIGALVEYGLGFTRIEDRTIHLPHRSFGLSKPEERIESGVSAFLDPAPVPGLWLVRFAYPVKTEWLDSLENCGLTKVGYFPGRTYLLRGKRVELDRCGIGAYVDWTGPYLTTDRVRVEYLSREGPAQYWMQFIHGTDLEAKVATLPEGASVRGEYDSELGAMSFVHVEATANALIELAATDADLLSISPYGIFTLSDERQGAIIAGLHNRVNVTTPGYRSWLSGRGLLTSSNQQVVGVIDTGYDDGSFNPSSPSVEEHHLDLERPERLAQLYSSFFPDDQQGHGTLVAGIIVGDGSQGTGSQDSQGYYLGSGIAPAAKLAVVKTKPTEMTRQETAIEVIRNDASSNVRGHIINQSWNESVDTSTYTPLTSYSALAQFFDQRTVDGNDNTGFEGDQPTLFVFSAGNFRKNCSTLNWNTVASPAVAKNVIAVGATRSDRPYPVSTASVTNPPADCRPCSVDDPTIPGQENFGRPPNENADHVSRVAEFSGRGRYFAPYPDTRLVYKYRVKPDVVAPAVRVYSTVPYDYTNYDNKSEYEVNGCAKYYPAPGHSQFGYHTYGSGTSFAAPVVSGAAALIRKKLLDAGINASPSLLKAGIIATADDLGSISGSGNGGDHRPSPKYGWGRVNLDRLTDSRSRFYRNEVASEALNSGESRTWTRTIGNGSVDTYIVLAWSDPAASVSTNSNAVLVNDLDLRVQGGVYRGNIFNETQGVDDGYSFRHQVCTCARDAINNVEAVFIPAGTFASGVSISLTVVGIDIEAAQGPQKFSIYAYNVQ